MGSLLAEVKASLVKEGDFFCVQVHWGGSGLAGKHYILDLGSSEEARKFLCSMYQVEPNLLKTPLFELTEWLDQKGWESAVEQGNMKVMAEFLEQSPTYCDLVLSDSRTAAHKAGQQQRLDILKMLFDQGANFSKKDKEGDTPLHDIRYVSSDHIVLRITFSSFGLVE